MRTIISLDELKAARLSFNGTVGLVPTMGYLHEGHLSLIRRAKAECDHVVVSIFVNPTQFGANEDLAKYPRDLERDLSLIEPFGVDLVWTPTPEIMYPTGYQTWVEVEAMTRPLEGAMRPTHFKGVTTVVAKLFNATQAHKAYFGQKDAQQVAVIRQMVWDLNFPLEVVVCSTVREADGLAMSSRNKYLEGESRQAATILFRALTAAKEMYQTGERDAEVLREKMKEVLGTEPLAQVQYVSCADYNTLEELDVVKGKTLLSMAVLIGKTRLIDNFVLG
ncbi:MAG TPA: pantoate--beta-alanine ligase [Anaerolineales bacterium]|nr:pantoate--beta-alanine ligase [Anaerolineales bacterium]HMV95769.1 pantoate--beta-alanine ligase [Anaerolineales bacterium]HMX18226.1 pantoate--beta-alanine ligase [Anaerolineales bacterium]HMX74230.1 pantoate--beta-alanine ligase [Anaerolineales bacterium]HMZ43457.1 pantoate--beta-alanine ligase [Anaerolineales bacterium]